MTKLEFQPIFTRLLKDYGMEKKMNAGQVASFFDYLRRHDHDDFLAAARQIPALEVATAYKPFPTAECIQHYILDAREERRYREKQAAPSSLSAIQRQGTGGVVDESPGGQAWAMMLIVFIKNGTGNYRQRVAAKFVQDYADWLADHPYILEICQDYVTHDYGYEQYEGQSLAKVAT